MIVSTCSIFSTPSRVVGKAVLVLLLVFGCATPQLPSGGPPDRIPPRVLAVTPDTNATQVRSDGLEILFSEYVNTASAQQAFSISPAFASTPRFRWRGRKAEVQFPEPLRENTTYVITFDNRLKDLRGVALDKPLSWAFSTGTVIDRANIRGHVVDPLTGRGQSGVDVFAYSVSDEDSISFEPAYRTQTISDGSFLLGYLPERRFAVLALEDRNRNRRPDPTEKTAASPVKWITATSVDSLRDESLIYFLTESDTTRPSIRRVRSASSNRHVVFFDESISLCSVDPQSVHLSDSLSGGRVPVKAVYIEESSPQQITVLTDSIGTGTYSIRLSAVSDSSHNLLPENPVTFEVPARQDTVKTRFVTFFPTGRPGSGQALMPGSSAGVRFNQPVDSVMIRSAISVSDTSGTEIDYAWRTLDGVTYLIDQRRSSPISPFDVLVNGSVFGTDSLYTQTFRIPADDELGSVTGTIDPAQLPIVLEIYSAGQPGFRRSVVPDSLGRFTFSRLPVGSYRIRFFSDPNRNHTWDSGAFRPFVPPERRGWVDADVVVRRRFDTELDLVEIVFNQLPGSPASGR